MITFNSFLLLVFISGSSYGSPEEHHPHSRDLPVATPELIFSHKYFLTSSLAQSKVDQRNLLIAAGIIPHPPEFRSQKHFYEAVLSEDYSSSKLYKYIVRQVLAIISSDEKLDESLRTLYGVRLPLNKPTDSNFYQTKKQYDYDQYSNVRKTRSSLTDNMEILTVNFIAPDEDSSARNRSETGESSSNKTNRQESNGTSSPKSLAENNIINKSFSKCAEVMTDFDKLISNRILIVTQETDSGADVTEHTTEAADQSIQDVEFLTTHDTFKQYTSSDRDQNINDEKLDVYSKTNSEYVTELSFTPVTPTFIENNLVTSSIDEADDSELMPIDVQLIDKVIPISADEYIYSVEKIPSYIESLNIEESQLTQEDTNFALKEAQKLIDSIKSKQMKENVPKKDELQRQIHKYRGIPGKHFPNYDDFPETSFVCQNKKHIPGFYADQETKCQVFHVCWPFRRESFLCPIGTTFNQAVLACDHWYKSNCSLSQAYFDVNLAFGESASTGTVGPMVDSLLTASADDRPIKTEVLSSMKDVSKLYIADVNFSETIANEELTHLYKFLPVKAKILIYSEPKFMESVRSAISKARMPQR